MRALPQRLRRAATVVRCQVRCSVRRSVRTGAAVLAALAAVLGAALPVGAQPVDFIALGDMPYGSDLTSGPAWRRMIELVNAEQPALTLHVGDFKDGISDCSDALFERRADDFRQFSGALVLTPGDNDWLDCQRRGADPLERLAALRQRFFAGPRSLGQQPIVLERQSDPLPDGATASPHAAYRENQRWWLQGVLFASFHTVGPENATDDPSPAVVAEALAREAANAAWIRAAFALAHQRQARALVLLTQANVLHYPNGRLWPEIRPGFATSVRDTLLPLADATRLPVLLVHGDTHRYQFDRPFQNPKRHLMNGLWRLEVFGHPQMHAVKVRIDPSAAQPFSVTPIWNPLSPDPRR